MATKSDRPVWRLIAVLRSNLPLGSGLAALLYETAARLHLARKESENVATDDGVGTVRAVGSEQLMGTIGGPGFLATLDTPAGRCEVSFIVTREGVDVAEGEAARRREEAQSWN